MKTVVFCSTVIANNLGKKVPTNDQIRQMPFGNRKLSCSGNLIVIFTKSLLV